jgi:hypothetical protein
VHSDNIKVFKAWLIEQAWPIELKEILMLHVRKMKIVVVLCLIVLNSCSTIQVPCTYLYERNDEIPDAFQIDLKVNNNFEFIGWSDILGEEKINGKWVKNKDTLLLKANQIEESKLISVKEITNKTSQGTIIRLLDKNTNEPLYGAEVYLNNDNKPFILGFEEKILITKRKINKFRIKYLEIDELIKVKNPFASEFFIYLDLKNKKLEKFHLNEKWLIKGNSIIPITDNNYLNKKERFIKKR